MSRTLLTLASAALLAVAASAISAAWAAAEGPRIGQVKTASGEAAILRQGAKVPARLGDPVYAADVVETGEHGSIGITFIDNTVFSAGPNSEVALDKFRFDAGGDEMLAELRRGTLSVVSGDITKKSPGALKIKTPTALLGVRGTTFAVEVAGDRQ
ncbi:MAG TPA: FecR family protein [Stellaceae bacterium]|nr:FecR family protein [Stellaceae bacterium]